jgi:hypothetical protein
MKDYAIGQGFYKTMFEISHHYNMTLASANVQFFLFLYVKGWNGINAFDVPKLEHLHPPHLQTHLFIRSCSRIEQILLLWGIHGPFCSGHFNPFKTFFLLWIWTVTITRPDVKT